MPEGGVILDLGPIPAFARRAYADEQGVYFDLTLEADTSPVPLELDARVYAPGGDTSPSLRNLDPEGPARKPGPPTSTPGCLPPFSRWAPAVVLSLSLSSLAACGRSAATPVADPPSASRGAVVISGTATSREDAMPRAGESPAPYPTKELRADGQQVAGADGLRPCAKDPDGREQHAVQHGAGGIDGIETGRRTGDEQHPTRAGNSVGRRGSEEGGPPTPSAAANLVDALDALVARADRLAATAMVASVAAQACAETCGLHGPKEIHLEPGRARCVCRGLPSLGVHRLPRKAARLETSARSERVGEPGAGEAGAGLAFAGGAR